MLSTKNYNNNSSINASTATFNSINTNTINIGDFTEINYVHKLPFGADIVLDFNVSNKFYIKSYDVDSFGYNYNLIIQNIPTDFNIYTLTLITYDTNAIYCNGLKVIDVEGNYIWGDANNFQTPYYYNGLPTLRTTPCIIVQEFSIIPIIQPYSSTPMKYVISDVKSNYTDNTDIYLYLSNNFYTSAQIDGALTNYASNEFVVSNINNVLSTLTTNYYTRTQIDSTLNN